MFARERENGQRNYIFILQKKLKIWDWNEKLALKMMHAIAIRRILDPVEEEE